MIGLAGCLYVGGINHAPEATIELDSAQSDLRLRGRALLRAVSRDADDDRLSYSWQVTVTDLSGEAYVLTDTVGSAQASSSGSKPPTVDTSGQLSLGLLLRGTYAVSLRVTDPEGARREASYSFEVPNADPEVALELVPVDGATVGDDLPAHGRYVISAARSSDADDDLSCGKGATIDWTLVEPAAEDLAIWRTLPCRGVEVLDKLELGAKPTTSPLRLKVRATVTDPAGGTGIGELEATLQANRPPCIKRSDPSFELADKVLVLYDPDASDGSGRTFEATHVDDDVPQQRYVWSRSAAPAGPYEPLAAYSGPRLELPANFAYPGDAFYLRLTVLDAVGGEPSCAPAERLCADDAALPAACYRWITWQVEFR